MHTRLYHIVVVVCVITVSGADIMMLKRYSGARITQETERNEKQSHHRGVRPSPGPSEVILQKQRLETSLVSSL